MGFIFSAVINTGVTGKLYPFDHSCVLSSSIMKACWALLNLAANPNWKERLTKEYRALVANHTNTLSTEPLHKRLASIPLNIWEDELPSVDLLIRETLRFTMIGPALRRNVQKDVPVDGVIIKRGDFVVYSMNEAHMNPDIYSNPTSFDPDRYLEGREEDKKETFSHTGWGAGESRFEYSLR
jgi:sterol 14-demethylase